jgi:hypothetical protein
MKSVVGLLLCLLLAGEAAGQVNATVGGTVSDASGALIPGVEVTVRNINTGIVQVRVTNESGAYEFPSVQPGMYSVTAMLPGFQIQTFNNVQLSQGQQVRYNFTLQVGNIAQDVQVIAETDSLLATTTASVGDVLPEREVLALPVASRNVLDLIATTAGAVGETFAGALISQVNTTRDGLTTNDGRYNNSNGVYSAIFTSPDLVEEVRVSVTSVDAAVGRGSGQVQMQTRAGTNDFHGALFYTNNNSALNSMSFFQNLRGAQKSYQNRNQFGGRLGGPIKKNKAFFFVLYDGQRYLEKQDVLATVLTPEARQGIFRYLTENSVGGTSRRNGSAFSTTPSVDLNGQVLTSSGGTPLFMNSFNLFTDVRDPNRTRIDPVWVGPQYLPRLPLPNDWTVGDGLNTAGFKWLRRQYGTDGATGESPNPNRNHLTVRGDYQINTNNKLTYTMSREENWGVTGQTGLPDVPEGVFGDVRRNPDFYTLAWTTTISPTVLNEFRFGFKRDTWQGTSAFDRGCCWQGAAESDIDEISQEAVASFPKVGGSFMYVAPGFGTGQMLARYAQLGVASPRASVSPFKQFADTVSFSKGRHSFSGGFEVDFQSSDQANHGGQATTRPLANLGVGNIPVPNINNTNFRGLNSNDVTLAQNILANLAGTISGINQQYFINSPTQTDWLSYQDTILFKRDIHQNDWAAFFKDNWKVTNNFTLNVGLRYDKYGTPYDTYGLAGRYTGGQKALFGISGTDFDAMWRPGASGGVMTTTEFVSKHSPNPDKTLWNDDWNNFAPSLGFSWSLPGFDRSTVLRGGYGINYAGAADFLGYSGTIGNLPGQTLTITNYAPAGYMDLSNVGSLNVVPVPRSGARPFEALPFTNRSFGVTGYADERVLPYIQSFNLSLQRELARNLTLDVGYVGNKATKLYSSTQLNESNIFENGILEAFNITRTGGDAELFNRIFNGLNVGGGVVNGTSLTGSEALRRFQTTNQWIANGEVGRLANYLNTTSAFTGEVGGLLRRVGLPENFIVVNPQFGSVNLAGNNINSTYHALQTQLTRRFSQGFSGQGSYTWSKSIGDTGSRDPRNRQLSKGLQESHRTHNFKANGTWELPFGPNRSLLAAAPSFVHRIVEGWQLSGIFSLSSGSPLDFEFDRQTIGSRADNTPDIVGVLPKDLGKARVRDGFVEYFEDLTTQRAPLPNFGGHATVAGRFTNQVVVDKAGNIIFKNPEPGKTGNASSNLFIEGPSRLGLDFAASKHVRFREGMSFTLRVDLINALNTPQWEDPVTDINAADFGRITDVRDNTTRTITINARIDF